MSHLEDYILYHRSSLDQSLSPQYPAISST